MLCYDFDIYYAGKTRGLTGISAARGLTQEGQTRSDDVIALFRDQETADAVTAAPSVVRLFLEETGFGFATSDKGERAGFTPANDEDARRDLVEQLTETLSNRALKKALSRVAKQSNFDVKAFITAVISAGSPDKQCDVDSIILKPGKRRRVCH